jgi:membrane protein YqaA with SNARE-associated domain
MKPEGNSGLSRRVKILGISLPLRTLIILIQAAFVLSLIVWWLASDNAKLSKNLWVLFFYSFPSEFLISFIPHEPVVLYFGKFYTPAIVALVSVVGTVATEAINYQLFSHLTGMKFFRKTRDKKIVGKIIRLFHRAPFVALCAAGIAPVPFYPFRILTVLARYPIVKYVLAVFVSRTPRFFLLAVASRAFRVPDALLIAMFSLFALPTVIAFFKKLAARLRRTAPERGGISESDAG